MFFYKNISGNFLLIVIQVIKQYIFIMNMYFHIFVCVCVEVHIHMWY